MNEGALKILLLSAEVAPFAKTGGLADVAGALPKALKDLGHDIRVAMPRYGCIDRQRFNLNEIISNFCVPLGEQLEMVSILEGKIGEQVPVYFINNDQYYQRDGIYMYSDDAERFLFFCRAALELVKKLDWVPDVIHCNDWHTAIIPAWLKTMYRDDLFFKNTVTIYTIHNLAYQGVFGERIVEKAGIKRYLSGMPAGVSSEQQLNMMGQGIFFADLINTVSETYAEEILTPEYGEGYDWLLRERRDRLYGIVNGIDTEVNNPATDPNLFQHYDQYNLASKIENKLALQREVGLTQAARVPLIGLISRLSDQKGFDLIRQVIEPMMQNLNFQFILLGTGMEEYHQIFTEIKQHYPERAAVYLTFNAALAQKIYAGTDMFLMPSRFEPCGLGQLLSMRYGSVPIVRETGGLKDTVQNYCPETKQGNGFTFKEYDAIAMYTALVRALETYHYQEAWQNIMQRGMSAEYSWRNSARKYEDLYRRALACRAEHPVWQELAQIAN